MDKRFFSNNAYGTLQAVVDEVSTQLVVDGPYVDNFPIPSDEELVHITVQGADDAIEIMRLVSRAGNTLTVERAQEGTLPRGFDLGSLVELRVTAEALNAFTSRDMNETVYGKWDFSQSPLVPLKPLQDKDAASKWYVDRGGYTRDHNTSLTGREKPDAHPVTAITGLAPWLLQLSRDAMSSMEVPAPLHGFAAEQAGSVIYFDGSVWKILHSDDPPRPHDLILKDIIDEDNIVVAQQGMVRVGTATAPTGLVPGVYYYNTAGGISATPPPPKQSGARQAPVLYALDAEHALVLPFRSFDTEHYSQYGALTYIAAANQQRFFTTTSDVYGETYLFDDAMDEATAVDVHVNGVKLVYDPGDGSVADADYMVDLVQNLVFLNNPLRDGDVVQISILVRGVKILPGNVRLRRLLSLDLDWSGWTPGDPLPTAGGQQDGTRTQFTLRIDEVLEDYPPAITNASQDVLIMVDGVPQRPDVDYQALGPSIIFMQPPAADSVVWGLYFDVVAAAGGGGGGIDSKLPAIPNALQNTIAILSAPSGVGLGPLNSASWIDGRPIPKIVPDAQARVALQEPRDIIPGSHVVEQNTGEEYVYLGSGAWFRLFPQMQDSSKRQSLIYNPDQDPLGLVWHELPHSITWVQHVGDLWDQTILPSSELTQDKLVYVHAVNRIFRFTGDPANPPTNRHDGLAQWQALTQTIQIVDTESDLPDPNLRPVSHGDTYLVAWDDSDPVTRKPLHRLYVWDENALGPNQGYWRTVNTRNWVKALEGDPDQPAGMTHGDFQATTEDGHKELKVFSNDAGDWVDLFTEQDIRSWIAALSLFRGTVAEVGGGAAGVIEVTALPDLPALTAAKDTGDIAHYWIWQGQDGYVIPNVGDLDEIGGGLSADLHGSRMNVGDWLQISDQGTPGNPDLHWTRVGGDLMTRKRWGDLTIVNWVAGARERGTIAVYDGKLYRASRDILPADPSPKTVETVITLTPGAPDTGWLNGNPTDTLPPAGVKGDGALVQATAAGTIPAGGEFSGDNYAAGDYYIYSTNPALAGKGTTKEGQPFDSGWVKLGQLAQVPATIDVTAPPPPSPWQEIPLAGGVKTVPADVNLPATEENGALYLVIQSAAASNNPRLTMFDKTQNKWVSLSGGAIKVSPTPAQLPQANNIDGDVRLVLDVGNRGHRSGFYKWDDTDQAWEEVCCAVPLAMSGGDKVYPDVVQMGGNIVGTPWEGQLWMGLTNDANYKYDPMQIYRDGNWEFSIGWGMHTQGAGTIAPSHNGVPSNTRAPNLKAYLCFEHYTSWIAPWVRMGVTGVWQRMRQNIAGSWKSVTKRNSYTGDIYGQDIGTETLSNLTEGDSVLIIATMTAYSTASPGTVSTGFTQLKINGTKVNEQYIELARGNQSSYTLHYIHKAPANQNAITIVVNVDGFSHSIRVRDCAITAFVIGKG